MKVQTKLIIFLSLVVLTFIIAFVIQGGMGHKRLHLLFEERKSEEMATFDKILELKGRSLETLAVDYTYWDEMVDFLVKDDLAWAQTIIDKTVLINYSANAIWIYKLDFSLAYSIHNVKDANLKDIPLPKEILNNLFLKEHFRHFSVNTAYGLMEVRGATIHPTQDVARKTPPQGYFFTGRLWDENYINSLSVLTGSKIALKLPHDKEEFTGDIRKGLITFSRILTDWDKKPLMRLDIAVKSKSMELFYQTYQKQFLLFLILGIVFLSFSFFFLSRTVSAPLKLISQSLDKEDTTYIDNLQKSLTEFGDISRLIEASFKQKVVLVKEIAERKKTEQELRDTHNKLAQTESHLMQSAKMASIGELASGVAHEINNPLTGVLNNVQLIKMELAQKKGFNLGDFKEVLDSIDESATRCKKIVQSLLHFSRASRGPFQFTFVNEVIEKTISLLENEINLENIFIQKKLSSDLPHILGDPPITQSGYIQYDF